MEQVFRIDIEIDNELNTSIRSQFSVNDAIFTTNERLFDFESLRDNVKLAMKMGRNWGMITVTLSQREYNVYTNRTQLSSFRFVKERSGEVKYSKWNGYSYNDFQESDIKNLMPLLKDIVERGNTEFIKCLKSEVTK